jgi:hypothetical protein
MRHERNYEAYGVGIHMSTEIKDYFVCSPDIPTIMVDAFTNAAREAEAKGDYIGANFYIHVVTGIITIYNAAQKQKQESDEAHKLLLLKLGYKERETSE